MSTPGTAWGRAARSARVRILAIVRTRMFRVLVFAGAVALGCLLLGRALGRYSLPELGAAVSAVPGQRLARAGLFAAASYIALTGFDYLALRCVGKPLAYRRAALASFASLSVGHTIGFAGLSSGAIRYRFYARWGLSGAEVAQVVLYCGITVAMGLCALAGLVLLMDGTVTREMLGLSQIQSRALAGAALAVPALYVLLSALPERVVRRRLWGLRRPPPALASAQVVVGTVNFALVAACLHQVVRELADVGFAAVASTYVAANTAALLTHVPGGLGVIETVVQHLLPGAVLIGPLLIFRLVYFLVPLGLGLLVLAASEIALRTAARPGPKPTPEPAQGKGLGGVQ